MAKFTLTTTGFTGAKTGFALLNDMGQLFGMVYLQAKENENHYHNIDTKIISLYNEIRLIKNSLSKMCSYKKVIVGLTNWFYNKYINVFLH